MSYGAEAICNLLDELGGEEEGSQKVLSEMISYLRSDELIKIVHHFRSMYDMIDDDPEEEESESHEDDNTEDMPSEIRTVLYPGHHPGYTDKPSYDPIDW